MLQKGLAEDMTECMYVASNELLDLTEELSWSFREVQKSSALSRVFRTYPCPPPFFQGSSSWPISDVLFFCPQTFGYTCATLSSPFRTCLPLNKRKTLIGLNDNDTKILRDFQSQDFLILDGKPQASSLFKLGDEIQSVPYQLI